MDYTITLRKNGGLVRVQESQTLFDADGNPVDTVTNKAHQMAVGLGDFTTDPANPTQAELDAFHARLSEICVAQVGVPIVTAIHGLMVAQAERDSLRAQVTSLTNTAQSLQNQLVSANSEKADLRSQISTLQAFDSNIINGARFVLRFTDDELEQMVQIPKVKLFIETIRALDKVDLSSARLTAALDKIEALGVIDAARKAELLAPATADEVF